MSGAAGGTFGGLEELVKLAKLGIGQQVLGIWNWAFWAELQFLSSTHCSLASGGGGFKTLARIPPGLRKVYRRVASFSRFLVCHFVVFLFRRVVLVFFSIWRSVVLLFVASVFCRFVV